MRITIASLTESGSRPYNEDSIGAFNKSDGCCVVLADGLGGHGKGEVASKTAVEAVKRVYFSAESPQLAEMFEAAQADVMEKQRVSNDFNSMKTTMVTALICGNVFTWGHIGDSRLYCFKKRKLITRTLDHSVPQMLVNAGEIKESEIRGHIDRNKLIRVIGTKWDTPRYQIGETMLLTGKEQFLLCSDGFWEYIDERQMIKLLKKSTDPQMWLEEMKKVILINGSGKNMDNYSAIAVFAEE